MGTEIIAKIHAQRKRAKQVAEEKYLADRKAKKAAALQQQGRRLETGPEPAARIDTRVAVCEAGRVVVRFTILGATRCELSVLRDVKHEERANGPPLTKVTTRASKDFSFFMFHISNHSRGYSATPKYFLPYSMQTTIVCFADC